MTNKQAEKYYGTEPIISEALDGVILSITQGEFFYCRNIQQRKIHAAPYVERAIQGRNENRWQAFFCCQSAAKPIDCYCRCNRNCPDNGNLQQYGLRRYDVKARDFSNLISDTRPPEQEDASALVKKIRKTSYKPRVHFSTITETISGKIKRMLWNRFSRCEPQGQAQRRAGEWNPGPFSYIYGYFVNL